MPKRATELGRRLAAVALLWTVPVWGQVGISPQTHDILLDNQQRSHSFRLFNLGDEAVEIKVSVANWIMDADNQVEVIPSTEQSLDQWMIVNPLHFTVQPGQSQAVRFAIRPAVELSPGEHRAIVYFNQVLPPDPSPERANVRSRFRLGAAVYGQVGPAKRQGELGQVRLAAQAARLSIASTGSANVRMHGYWSLWPADRFPGLDSPQAVNPEPRQPNPAGMLASGALPTTPVLPGYTREIVIPITGLGTASPGSAAVLVLHGALGKDRLHAAIPVTIPEPASED